MRIICSLLIMLMCVSAALADSWGRYVNGRFGAAADIPPGFTRDPPSVNGDGQTFTSADGASQIAVWGAHLDPSQPFADYVARQKQFFQDDGGRITYEASEKAWAVFSGFTKDGHITYIRINRACEGLIAHHVSLEYPKDQKQPFDPVVKRVETSLAADAGYDCK